jgi:isopentenyl-diphosphate delta-isomerase
MKDDTTHTWDHDNVKPENMSDIERRKQDHLQITLSKDVACTSKKTGFEKWDFIHCALPEIDLNKTDTTCSFLSRQLSFPFMIAGMTGGMEQGERINFQLAEVAETMRIALALGSMRIFFENTALLNRYKSIRTIAPSIPLIGNIGAVNLVRHITPDDLQTLVDGFGLDAFALHLNPLQEAIQPEGDTDFTSVLHAIEKVAGRLTCPVMVKETGAGISYEIAQKLKQVGATIIDVSGAGGTSWAAIEGYRSDNRQLSESFRNWGIPTADCIETCRQIPGIILCASGGIDDGITIAKAIALGADITASARQILRAYHQKSQRGLENLLNHWQKQLQLCMFLTGSKTIADLNQTKLRRIS